MNNGGEYTYPGNKEHGEAWTRFTRECAGARVAVPGQHSAELWPWFLAGWLEKTKQRRAHGKL